ncbi:MAG: TRAP transporter large permease subunit, partial [Eubacteriales bacterium]|nr:TRAP transporter large permease subunit [Eubacteriales bacterium]
MPIALVYLGIMLAVILIWFLVFKRPVYESIFLSFLVLVAVSGTWANIPKYINSAMKTSLMFTMFAFVAMAQLLGKTKVIDSCIQVILALFGRVPGGAGYVSIIGSSFMGALSGSGPGNVMATGVFTIPPMIRSGYPRHLAANVESNASYLGNMIPPSSNIVAALGAYTALFPEENMSSGDFWICMWGVSLWFIVLKLVMLFCFCKYYKVTAMQPEDIPNLKESIKNGWKGLLLPVIIFVPFMLDSVAKETFIAARLGAGNSNFSSSLLLVVPGVAALYSMAICPDKSFWNPVKLAAAFSGGLKSLCGTISPCLFGYMVGALFTDLGVAEGLQAFLTGMTFGKFAMVVFIVIMTCFM